MLAILLTFGAQGRAGLSQIRIFGVNLAFAGCRR
jgi:hypothetical protein